MSSPFQTQSQWENEQEIEASFSTDNQKKKGIVVKKKTLMVVGVILVLAIASAGAVYTYGRSIEGIWVRQLDDNPTTASMTIEVRRNNGNLEGVIVSMPAGAESFEVGQVKWLGIRKTGFGQYSCYSLVSEGTTYRYSNAECKLIVSSSGDQLSFSSGEIVGKGNYQTWIKQKNK